MTTDRRDHGAQHIVALFESGALAGYSDAQLLDRFRTQRGRSAEMAFEAIVRRHGPMVMRVCRSILACHHDAQDAFQATFLVLVRRSDSLRNTRALAAWLHGVALRVSRCDRAAGARRRASEGRVAALATIREER